MNQMNSIGNTVVNRSLCNAMAALNELDERGATVLSVDVNRRNPRVTIDPGEAFIAGAVKSRIVANNEIRRVMVATLHGCQVEWQERFREPRAAAHG